jgi:hypothetical protein
MYQFLGTEITVPEEYYDKEDGSILAYEYWWDENAFIIIG